MEYVTEEDIRDVFDLLDEDRSGFLDLKELGNGLRALGQNPSESQLEALFRKADVSSDAKITFDEFTRLFTQCEKKNKVSRDELMKDLAAFDKNGDGIINSNELKEILCNGGEALSEIQATEIIRDFDKNGDGCLSIEELITGLLSRK